MKIFDLIWQDLSQVFNVINLFSSLDDQERERKIGSLTSGLATIGVDSWSAFLEITDADLDAIGVTGEDKKEVLNLIDTALSFDYEMQKWRLQKLRTEAVWLSQEFPSLSNNISRAKRMDVQGWPCIKCTTEEMARINQIYSSMSTPLLNVIDCFKDFNTITKATE